MTDSETRTTAPVFILSSERSGSNLLRRRLTEYQADAFGPPPLHLLKHLFYAQPYYGDISEHANFLAFATDALGLAHNHFSPWRVDLDSEMLWEWHRQNWKGPISATSVMHALFTLYAKQEGFGTYICKDNNVFSFAGDVVSTLPDARFIFLYRDPRDVVASQLERPTQTRSIAALATLWRDEQLESIQAAYTLERNGKRIVRLSYEDLVANEEAELGRVCDALGLKRTDALRENVYVGEQTEIHEWKNLGKATSSTSVGRYSNSLSARAVRMIEHVAWHQMRYLGYATQSVERPRISHWAIRLDQAIGRLKRGILLLNASRNLTEGQQERARFVRQLNARMFK